jgi:hypothetical protein
MTSIIDAKSKRPLSAKLVAGLAISAFVLLGTYAASASAQERRDDRRGEDHRGGDRERGGDWGGGGDYYSAPPVVYGSPYAYPPPPVVYGPAIGITLPGINIGIQ